MTAVTLVGSGLMARAIATRVLAGGGAVQVLGESTADAERLAAELGEPGRVTTGAVGDEVTGDVVVLAVPYAVELELAAALAETLDGKVVVDISNPVNTETFERIVPDAGSGAQEVAAAAPGARVVKAFNTTFAGTVAAGEVSGQPLDVLLASDDEEAKKTVASVAEDGGLRAVDAGPLERARELEAAGYLHMVVQEGLGTGYGSALRIVA